MVSLFSILFALSVAPLSLAQSVCNGREEYCGRRYSDITFVGAHNSPFVGPLPQHNQEISVTGQLNLGIRFLQGQTHLDINEELHMCHTSCVLEDAGTLESYLGTIKSFLDANPEEVITLLITNGDRLDVGKFDDAFKASKINDYIYVPKSNPKALPLDAWPTLGELVSSNKRLIVFLDYLADTNKTPYILDEFAYFFETPFSTTDPKFEQCDIDRPDNVKADGRLYLVNHTLNVDVLGALIPDRIKAPKTNAASGEGSIGAHADLCNSIHGRKPDVVLVDFVTKGEVIKAQDRLNGF